MIVIDIGCASYGGTNSIGPLIKEFQPDQFYGFDPSPALRDFTASDEMRAGKTSIYLAQMAAWTHEGEIGYVNDGFGWVADDRPGAPKVRCFDLAAFINEQEDSEIILKLDCEGSEYVLLDNLIARGADTRLERCLVEWHDFGVDDPAMARKNIEQEIACELGTWNA